MRVTPPARSGALPAGLALLLTAASVAAAGGPAGETPTPETPPRARLVELLYRAVAVRSVPPDLHVEVDWREGTRFRRLEVWGDGIGIWEGSRQFRLGREELVGLAEALLASGLEGMDEAGPPGEEEGVREVGDSAAQGVRIRERVRVEAGGLSLEVRRTVRQPPFPELARLVERVVALCAGPAARGVAASGLSDALAKERKGTLAPQALRLSFQVLDETPGPGGVRPGWILQLNGRSLSVRDVVKGTGAGDVRRKEISSRQFGALVRELARAELETAPAALYSERYEDLSVDVLGQLKAVQARRFAGLSRGTHAGPQARYERLVRVLSELAAGVPPAASAPR